MQRLGNTNLYIDMPSKVTLVSQSLKGYVLLERKVLKTIDSSISDQNRGLGCLQMDFSLKYRHQSITVLKVNYGIESTI